MDEFKIEKIIINEMPTSCGECPLMIYEHDNTPICTALPENIRGIQGNPYDMTYRRSDCMLTVKNKLYRE